MWNTKGELHPFASGRLRAKGFTLVEIACSMMMASFLGLSVISGTMLVRQASDLDKQRLAAMNYCRQALESAIAGATAVTGRRELVPFENSKSSMLADVNVTFYPMNTNGTVNWASPQSIASSTGPTLCRVAVQWRPAGSWSRPQQLSMSTLVRNGIR